MTANHHTEDRLEIHFSYFSRHGILYYSITFKNYHDFINIAVHTTFSYPSNVLPALCCGHCDLSSCMRILTMDKTGYRNRFLFAFIAVLLGISGCYSHARKVEADEPVVHYPGSLINFSRHCADEKPYTVQGYALFASANGRARALVAPWAGYTGIDGKLGMGVRLESFALDAEPQWGEGKYSLRFEAQAEKGRKVTGAEVTTYHASEPGGPPLQQVFETTAAGQARWLTFVEPDEASSDSDLGYRFAPLLDIKVSALDMQDHDAAIQLAVIVRDLEGSEEIRMMGPSLKIPERVWSMKPPAHGVLNLQRMLNPFQEGGVFRTVGRAWKYRKCIDERRAAKKEFRSFSLADTSWTTGRQKGMTSSVACRHH